MIQNEKNLCNVILDIKNILKLQRMQSLTIEGTIERKTAIFKTLALLKVAYLALLTVIPNHIIDELIKVQSKFTWKSTPAKIKHKTLIRDHKQGGLKCTDVTLKTISLQCLGLNQLFDDSFHD